MRLPRVKSSGPMCDFDRTVTPMVDVVFQLLVFFVLASGGKIAERTLSTALASGSVASVVPQPAVASERTTEIWLHLRRDSADRVTTVRVNNAESGELSRLPDALRGAKGADSSGSSSSIILDVPGNIPWGDVIRAYDACRSAKFRAINFAADPAELH
jgi:biopolymer transport protein ExbD